jgi:hypothetical protein
METGSVDIGVLWVIGRPLEGSSAESSSLNFITPYLIIDSFEVVFQQKAVLLTYQPSSLEIMA